MTKSAYMKMNFNGGELSPLLDGRVDYPKYASGAKQMQNFVPTVYGPMTKRPGTRYVETIADILEPAPTLIAFEFSEQQSYMIALTDQMMLFYFGDGRLLNSGLPFELPTPYDSDDIDRVRTAQTGDIMYFVHPDYPVYKLSRINFDEFTFEPVEFLNGPFNDENTEDITVDVVGGIDIDDTGVLTASDDIFVVADEGSLFRFTYIPSIYYDTWEPESHDFSGTDIKYDVGDTLTYLNNTYLVTGFESGTAAQRTGRRAPLHEEGIESDGALLLEYTGSDFGYVEITTQISTTEVEYLVKKNLPRNITGNPSKQWSFGSFNGVRGYPNSVTFHQQRLVFGGTLTRPQTVFGSEINLFESFTSGTNDDNAYQFTLAATKQNAINWLASNQTLQVGTGGSEFDVSSSGSTITPTDVVADQISTYGSSATAAPIVTNGFTLFVQGGGKKIRELRYDDNTKRSYARDLNKVAEHVTVDGNVLRMAYQGEPYQVIWCVVGAELWALTYEVDEDVFAWHKHEISGQVGSIGVIPNNFKDRLWITVLRDNGWMIEFVGEFFNSSMGIEDGVFVDSSLSYDGRNTTSEQVRLISSFDFAVGTEAFVQATAPIFDGALTGEVLRINSGFSFTDLEVVSIDPSSEAATVTILSSVPDEVKNTNTDDWAVVILTVTGLDHLEGKEVSILNNGSVEANKTVQSGSVELDYYTSYCHIGLPLSSIWQSMRLEGGSQDGVGQGKSKHGKNIILRLENTGAGLLYGRGELDDNGDPIDADSGLFPIRTGNDYMDNPPSLISRDSDKGEFAGGHSKEFFVRLKHELPVPCTIVSFIMQIGTNEA